MNVKLVKIKSKENLNKKRRRRVNKKVEMIKSKGKGNIKKKAIESVKEHLLKTDGNPRLTIAIVSKSYENLIEVRVSGRKDILQKLEEYEELTDDQFDFKDSGNKIIGLKMELHVNEIDPKILLEKIANSDPELKETLDRMKKVFDELLETAN